ncbi:hypothetical protein L842_2765 [Mycobacterium intracellulare MIN_052511_1280]|nr:hypothetical protein L842_2765 [Mycobacterium intracellulare MIN_052511_1280]
MYGLAGRSVDAHLRSLSTTARVACGLGVACGEVPTSEGDAEIGLEALQTVH